MALALVSCASMPAKPSQVEPLDLSDVEGAVMVADLVSVMVQDWPAAHTPIVVSAQSDLPEILESRLREAGYAVAGSGDLRQVVELQAARIGGLPAYRAGLLVGHDWQLDRRYSRDHSGRLRPSSGFTLRGGRGVRGPQEPLGYRVREEERAGESVELRRAWQVELKRDTRKAPLEAHRGDLEGLGLPALVMAAGQDFALRVGPFQTVGAAREASATLRQAGYPEAVLIDVAESRIGPTVPVRATAEAVSDETSAGPCVRIRVDAGSLRTNAARLLEECGYRLGRWLLGTDTEAEDLIIPVGYEVQVEGEVWGLLAFLEEAYRLRGRVRELDGAVDFESSQ